MPMNNIYLLPMMIAVIVILVNMIFSQKLKYDKRFASDLSNRLYALSFVKPFVWFINPDENDPKVKKEELNLKKAGLDHLLNYRTFMTLQVVMFLIILVIYSILFLFMDQIMAILDFVFRIDNKSAGTPPETKILIGVILLSTLILPKYYVKNRVKKNEYYFVQELPVIQLSVILMLRAKRPINDIMYTLGHNQTRYRRIFQKANRIYLRNKAECWEYLRDEFRGTGFEDTVDVLASMDNYSREETIRVLENGMEFLIQRSAEQKHSGAALGNLFSQFSMAIPFGGLMLLGAVPFATFIFEMMSNQSVF